MKSIMKKYGILFSILIVLSLLICFFFIFFVSFYFFMSQNNEQTEQRMNQYKYLEMDYSRNEPSFGIVSLSEEIEDFISYEDETLQKQIVISNFATDEYECFGSCYCEQDTERRISHGISLIKGVSYFLAAVSSIVAMNVAKEYFSEKCEEKYSHVCQAQSIVSKVERCSTVMNSDNKVGEDSEEEDVEQRKYLCYGTCVTQSSPHPVDYRPTNKINCEELKKEGEVTVYANELKLRKIVKPDKITKQFIKGAGAKFQEEHLKQFCRDSSKVDFMYPQTIYKTKENGEIDSFTRHVKEYGWLCAGRNTHSETPKSPLRNVKCRQIEPKPTGGANVANEKVWWDRKASWDKI